MKKVLLVTGVAVLALASVTSAAFSTNLTVGSRGADVTALQNWLITNGFSIPAGATGYFGSQTKAAVIAYQKSVGLPAYGFFGPLTQAKVNGTASLPSTGTITAPVGQGGAISGITTPGIPGSLVLALQSTYNNPTLDKSKSVDVARYKLQADASDMAVSSLSLDFDNRFWLYASAITVKDDAGAVVASKVLSAADFSELTVGTSYRLTIPVSYIVPKATSKYLTVNVTMLSVSDRSSGTLTITQAQARTVDGTGVTVTVSDGTDRAMTYTGANNNNIVATINSSSPAVKLVQISTSVETDNVVLGVFDLKSQNNDSNLRTLKIAVNTNSLISTLFNDVKIKIGGNTFSADTLPATATGTLTFSNLNSILAKDTYVPVTVIAKVAKNVNGTASTSLTANTTNIVAEDASYNTVTVTTSGAIASNDQTFTVSGVVASNITKTLEASVVPNAGGISRIGHISFTLTAGDSAIYVSKTQDTAVSTSTTASSATLSSTGFVVDNTSGDAATYFYIAPGQSKTFTADYKAAGTSATSSSLTTYVSAIVYGTSTSALTTGALSSSDIQNATRVTFF